MAEILKMATTLGEEAHDIDTDNDDIEDLPLDPEDNNLGDDTPDKPEADQIRDILASSLQRQDEDVDEQQQGLSDLDEEEGAEFDAIQASLVLEVIGKSPDGAANVKVNGFVTPTPSRKGSIRRKFPYQPERSVSYHSFNHNSSSSPHMTCTDYSREKSHSMQLQPTPSCVDPISSAFLTGNIKQLKSEISALKSTLDSYQRDKEILARLEADIGKHQEHVDVLFRTANEINCRVEQIERIVSEPKAIVKSIVQKKDLKHSGWRNQGFLWITLSALVAIISFQLYRDHFTGIPLDLTRMLKPIIDFNKASTTGSSGVTLITRL